MTNAPFSLRPMEAKLADALPSGTGWQFEPKWDGFRRLAFKAGNKIELRAKSGKPLGRYFPEVVEALAVLKNHRFIVDGELVIEVDDELSFDALQMRLHPAATRVVHLAKETPARLMLFDMLQSGEDLLMRLQLSERRNHLEEFFRSIENARCTGFTAPQWVPTV